MNRAYNHVKYFAENNEVVISNIHRSGSRRVERTHRDAHEKHQAKQLNDKQHNTGFDYYEYNMLMFGTPS